MFLLEMLSSVGLINTVEDAKLDSLISDPNGSYGITNWKVQHHVFRARVDYVAKYGTQNIPPPLHCVLPRWDYKS
jgi:hypothetical protein